MIEPNDIMFLDIESVPLKEKLEELPPPLIDCFLKKVSYKHPEGQFDDQGLWEKYAALYPEFAKIVCISVGRFNSEEGFQAFTFADTETNEEAIMLESFRKAMDARWTPRRTRPEQFTSLCAHNGLEFDFQFLAKRLIYNGLQVPKILRVQGMKPWELSERLIDTFQIWKFGSYKESSGLRPIALSLGIEDPKDEMDGAEVQKYYYREGGPDWQKIIKYCEKDVITNAKVYKNIYSACFESN